MPLSDPSLGALSILPTELILAILVECNSAELVSLCRTSRGLLEITLPVLYHEVTLNLEQLSRILQKTTAFPSRLGRTLDFSLPCIRHLHIRIGKERVAYQLPILPTIEPCDVRFQASTHLYLDCHGSYYEPLGFRPLPGVLMILGPLLCHINPTHLRITRVGTGRAYLQLRIPDSPDFTSTWTNLSHITTNTHLWLARPAGVTSFLTEVCSSSRGRPAPMISLEFIGQGGRSDVMDTVQGLITQGTFELDQMRRPILLKLQGYQMIQACREILESNQVNESRWSMEEV